MAAPVYVNAGAKQGQSFGTSVTPPLPASRVNGNLLIVVAATGNVTKTFTMPAGWTTIDAQINDGTGAVASILGYRYVDGSETAPAISWTGSTSAEAQVLQYSGVVAGTPIGVVLKTSVPVALTTTPSIGSITLGTNNAMTVVIVIGDTSNSATIGTATNYTRDENFGTGGSHSGNVAAYSQTNHAVAGNTSDTFSATASANRRWMTWALELRSENPVTDLNLAATNHGLGVSEAAAVTLEARPDASASLGVSMAATIQKDASLSAAPSLGISMAAAVQLEEDESAALALGVSMSAALITIFNIPVSGNLGLTMTASVLATPRPPQPVIIVAS